jgi:hypothetical protein
MRDLALQGSQLISDAGWVVITPTSLPRQFYWLKAVHGG